MTPSQFDILLQRLIAMETPKVVVFLVILVWHLDIPKPPQEYQFLEFYAGVGRIATLAKWCGFATAAVDIRQYTFKFAGTVTRLLPKIREDTRSQKFPAKELREEMITATDGTTPDVPKDGACELARPDASLASALQGALFVPSDEPCVEDPYLPPVEVEDQPSEMGPLDDPYFVGGVDNSTAEEVSQECLDPMMQHIASLGSKLPDEVRRDKYEKHIELFWVEKKMAGRKRKREIFEEDEELSESEYDKLKNADSNMPDNMGLDTDDTGATASTLQEHGNALQEEMKGHSLSGNVPISKHHFEENGEVADLEYLRGRDVLHYLLRSYPWTLLGGLDPGEEAQNMLDTFWRLYRREHPTHQIFQLADDNDSAVNLRFCVPLMVHGDGARTLKKQPLEVISLHPVLGLDTVKKKIEDSVQCTCWPKQTYGGCDTAHPMAQKLNSKHLTYLTHFLLCAFPSKKFKKLPGLLLSVLEAISQDLGTLSVRGIVLGNDVYHFAVLGMMGDLEYHAKTGVLTRSYQNVGHKNFIPCCHLCAAGSINHPFEDVREQASWKGTLFHSPPWNNPPPFRYILFEDWSSGLAARWFRLDPFHLFRLGVARNFIASAVMLMASDGIFDLAAGDSKSVDARLGRAWAQFSLWCDTHSVRVTGIRAFTREKFHAATKTSFPWVGCKGADSIILLKWLKWCSAINLASCPDSQVLGHIHQGCEQSLAFQGIHRHGIWLTNCCRAKLQKNCQQFLASYAWLAHVCLQRRLQLFAQVPKIHGMAHVQHRLSVCSLDEFCWNPANDDCSMSEDFVGRIARQSRRVGHKHVVSNTIHAYKVKSKMTLMRFHRKRKLSTG
ncbi:Uncharacterized protein SCF082_LOCUS39732 [Durusdinium trenchii]|uniref:Uncharacterized protein n=1 Tax=Durusdinium trenchii TaxID=1381693 RepID=A0ABP0Q671_9DINO